MLIVYSPRYNFRIPFLDKLYWFDCRKFERVMQLLTTRHPSIASCVYSPGVPLSREACLDVHLPDYLDSLRSSRTVASILEFPPVAYLPGPVVEKLIVGPQMWMAAGTVLAGELAWTRKEEVFNIGGGFHHACPDHGEGFCLVADIPLMIRSLRSRGLTGKILYVDVDAHMGNGVARCLMNDRDVVIVDLFNRDIYPADIKAADRIDIPVRLPRGVEDEEYLTKLSTALDAASKMGPFELCVITAGTDVYEADPIGKMSVSVDGVCRRDAMIFAWCRTQNLPFVVLTGGGYTKESAKLVAMAIGTQYAGE